MFIDEAWYCGNDWEVKRDSEMERLSYYEDCQPYDSMTDQQIDEMLRGIYA